MLDIAFVVLSFNVYKVTVNCIKSIISNIDTDNYRIIVVDNGSANNVGARLENKFSDNRFVTVLLNKENVGFARGNNIGIGFVHERFGGAKFICCLNNDTLLDQSNICGMLCKIYDMDKSIAVIGPRIFGRFFSEFVYSQENMRSKEEYRNFISKLKDNNGKLRVINSKHGWKARLLRNNLIYDLNHFRRDVGKKLSILLNYRNNYHSYYDKIEASKKGGLLTGKYDIVLHGCCLFFTQSFFEDFDGFDDSTFLYGEEAILYLDVIHHGRRTFKSDDMFIRYLGGVSTRSIFGMSNKSTLSFSIDSIKAILERMEKYGIE